MILPVLVLLFFALLAPAARAQVLVETPDGTVEFIGLERWSVEMIRDSLAVHAQGIPLSQSAAILEKLGFVSASARRVQTNGGPVTTVVTVVEPHRQELIAHREVPTDSLHRPEYAVGVDLWRQDAAAFQGAIQLRGVSLNRDSSARAVLARPLGERAENARNVWTFLDDQRSDGDLKLAIATLGGDANSTNAIVAAAILTNFPDRDEAWLSLLDATTDPREQVAAMAAQALRGLTYAHPDAVDWGPSEEEIRNLIAGTNFFVLDKVLAALAATRISPDLAAPLLSEEGGGLVLALLSAQDANMRDSAHAFLVRLNGGDLGFERGRWEVWIAGLR